MKAILVAVPIFCTALFISNPVQSQNEENELLDAIVLVLCDTNIYRAIMFRHSITRANCREFGVLLMDFRHNQSPNNDALLLDSCLYGLDKATMFFEDIQHYVSLEDKKFRNSTYKLRLRLNGKYLETTQVTIKAKVVRNQTSLELKKLQVIHRRYRLSKQPFGAKRLRLI